MNPPLMCGAGRYCRTISKFEFVDNFDFSIVAVFILTFSIRGRTNGSVDIDVCSYAQQQAT